MATLVICTRRQRPRLLPRTLSSALVRTAAARLALCSCHRGNQRRLASERLRRARGGGIHLIRSPHARLAHHQCPRHLERRRYRRHSHGHRQSHARPLFAPFFSHCPCPSLHCSDACFWSSDKQARRRALPPSLRTSQSDCSTVQLPSGRGAKTGEAKTDVRLVLPATIAPTAAP